MNVERTVVGIEAPTVVERIADERGVALEIGDGLGRAVRGDVRRARDDSALEARQLARHEVALVERPHANGEIEPRVDDVHQVVRERELDLHLGKLGEKARKNRHQHEHPEPDGRRYADEARGFLRGGLDVGGRTLGLDEQRCHAIVERAALCRETLRARAAAQKRASEQVLELREPSRQRGLRNAERAPGAAQRTVLDDANEQAHRFEVGNGPSFHEPTSYLD